MLSEESKQFLEDPEIPLWAKLLNLDASRWERSRYAVPHTYGDSGAHRLKDLNILKVLGPGQYQAAVEDVKAFKETAIKHNGTFKKLGSIPTAWMNLHPELKHDKSAQDKFFRDYPEFRTNG